MKANKVRKKQAKAERKRIFKCINNCRERFERCYIFYDENVELLEKLGYKISHKGVEEQHYYEIRW